MSLKIIGLVSKCEDCPNYRYYSGGKYICSLTGQIVPDKDIIPLFCPLKNFPSDIISNLETTVRTLREPDKYNLAQKLMSHIATRLKTVVSESGVVTINLKDGSVVYLNPHYITKFEIIYCVVYFVYENIQFKLISESDPPILEKMIKKDDYDNPLSIRVDLA